MESNRSLLGASFCVDDTLCERREGDHGVLLSIEGNAGVKGTLIPSQADEFEDRLQLGHLSGAIATPVAKAKAIGSSLGKKA